VAAKLDSDYITNSQKKKPQSLAGDWGWMSFLPTKQKETPALRWCVTL